MSESTATRSLMKSDLVVLTKMRLNTFVLVTTLFGYLLGARSFGWDAMTLIHTILGTAAAAFGSAAYNQLMEVELDARMERTADRPLPSRRMGVLKAFVIGTLLSAFGLVHLAVKVGPIPAALTALTLITYVFCYTPLKQVSSLNTLVGAIPGAIPPLIGWTAAGAGLNGGAWFLFALLFLWQLPHFIAINWLCREEYEAAGYRMWSNGDVSGRKSAMLAAVFASMLALLSIWPWMEGRCSWPWVGVGMSLAGWMAVLALRFGRTGERARARRLFLFTLLYLPLALITLLLCWRA